MRRMHFDGREKRNVTILVESTFSVRYRSQKIGSGIMNEINETKTFFQSTIFNVRKLQINGRKTFASCEKWKYSTNPQKLYES